MRKGEAKLSAKSLDERRRSIGAKCHPAMSELAQVLGDSIEALKSLGPNPSKEAIAEIQTELDERIGEIQRQYSGPVSPAPNTFAAQTIFSKSAMESESDALGVVEWLHWERHRVPMQPDAKAMHNRDWDASRRLQRTMHDLEQLRCGKGPIQPFKVDMDHWSFFEVLWCSGIEGLTPDELAIFFDDFCPCCSEMHEPESLKKQRARFRKALEAEIQAH
jgi:hypothetical protein